MNDTWQLSESIFMILYISYLTNLFNCLVADYTLDPNYNIVTYSIWLYSSNSI
jgi:hypothetical protein